MKVRWCSFALADFLVEMLSPQGRSKFRQLYSYHAQFFVFAILLIREPPVVP